MSTRARIETTEGNFQTDADGYPERMLEILEPGMGREALLEAGFQEIEDEAQAMQNVEYIYKITAQDVEVSHNNWASEYLGQE